jgi:pyruvate/2-oxoacid:ferredoxin oxidoreductase beta subunit
MIKINNYRIGRQTKTFSISITALKVESGYCSLYCMNKKLNPSNPSSNPSRVNRRPLLPIGRREEKKNTLKYQKKQTTLEVSGLEPLTSATGKRMDNLPA